MEDIGDILFYIIAAVIGLVTTLGKKKKKKTGVPVPPGAEPVEEMDKSPVFEEIEEIEYQVDGSDFVVGEQRAFDPVMEGKYIEGMAEQFSDEGKAQLVKEEEKAKPVAPGEISGTEEEEVRGDMDDLLSDFDLRKAVIYSEILDRKDY